MILQLFANGLCSGALYATVALGFGIIYKSTGVFHFAHGAVYVISAYLLYLVWSSLGLWAPLAIVISLAGTALAGVVTEVLVYRPIERRHLSPLATLIGSFGFYLFVGNLIALLAGNETKVLRAGVDTTFIIGSIILTRYQLMALISFILILVAFFWFKKTQFGQLLSAFADNPSLLEVLGWNSSIIRIAVFAAGSVLAGVAAILSALDIGMDPHMGMNALLISAVAVILGGVKVLEGGMLGGIILGIVQSLIVWQFSARWMDVFTFAILIFFLLLRPEGLLGQKVRLEEVK